jgi:membrane protein YqaA with SNARE-associated domain
MLNVLIQSATPSRGHGITSVLGHLGALGLFFVAIIDSSPLPTFGGPDILTAILAGRQTNPWYEFAAVATAGSVIGAYFTFRIARRAGSAYLHSRFGSHKVDAMLQFFQKWGTGALVASTAIPFPFPTSLLFAAAGASKYSVARFLTVVTICRGARYTLVAIIADHYGRHFVRVLRHPVQYWGWLLLFAAIILSVILAGVMLNKRLAATTTA